MEVFMIRISGVSEKIHGVLPSLWNVSDLHVLLEGLSEIVDILFESLTLCGSFEGFHSSSGGLGLLVAESSTIGLFELWLPFRLLKFLHLVFDILQFILNLLKAVIVDKDMIFARVDGFVESSKDIMPLSRQFLSVWGLKEFLLQFASSLSFW